MHVVHFGADLEDATTNGVNRVVNLLARQQRELGCRVTLVRLADAPLQDFTDEATGIRVLVLPRSRLPFRLSEPARRVIEDNSLGADVFHFHSVFMPEHNFAARRAAVPYVVTPHGAYHPRALQRSRWRKHAYRYLLDQRYLAGAGVVQALSEDEADSINRYAPATRIVTVPNPFPAHQPISSEERAKARSHFGLSDSDFCVVTIGRQDVEHKGLDFLIDASRRARPKMATKLFLAGPIDGAVDIRTLVREDDGDSIAVLPAVFNAEKRRLLAAADVFASVSRWDGFNGAVQEGLALGLPVVISRATGLGSFVDRTKAGVIVEPEAAAIADAYTAISRGDLQLLRGRDLAMRTQQEFDPRRIARRFIDLYGEVTQAEQPAAIHQPTAG